MRELGVIILEKFGYTVLSVGDGQEALDVYEKEQGNISLVILDIIMPRMDGKECLEQLLRINPTVESYYFQWCRSGRFDSGCGQTWCKGCRE